MRISLIISIFLFVSIASSAQTDNMGIGTLTPDTSARLEVSANNKGFLTPRMTSADRNAISNPAEGLLVYDLSTSSFWYFKSGNWTELLTQIPPVPSNVLFSSLNQTGVAGIAEVIMGSFVIPSSTFSQDGQFIDVHAFGEMTTDTSVIRLKFGTNTFSFPANSQGKWELKARLYRVSVSDAKFTGTISLNGTSLTEFQAAAQDFSTAIPFQITGQQIQPIVNGISLEGFSITRLQ
jgi:hypothetical protein